MEHGQHTLLNSSSLDWVPQPLGVALEVVSAVLLVRLVCLGQRRRLLQQLHVGRHQTDFGTSLLEAGLHPLLLLPSLLAAC